MYNRERDGVCVQEDGSYLLIIGGSGASMGVTEANSTARPYPVRPRPFGVKGTNETAQRAGANGQMSGFRPLSTHPRSKLALGLG